MNQFYSVFINLDGDTPNFEENSYYLTLKEAKKMAIECQYDGYITEIINMTEFINNRKAI